jgi:UDPglucose 6-dehydrogenase
MNPDTGEFLPVLEASDGLFEPVEKDTAPSPIPRDWPIFTDTRKTMIIAFYGLGKLGLPYAALLADEGNTVLGIDPNDEVRNAVLDGEVPDWIVEPGLDALVARVVKSGKLTAVNFDHPELLKAQASIILVPTPSKLDGSFSNEFVLQACRDIGRRISHSTDEHLVLLVSTVSPGSTGGPIRRTLEVHSGRKVESGDIALVYSPEFVQLGNVIEGMKNPFAVLVGMDGELSSLFGDVLVAGDNVPIQGMSWEAAELAKLGLNVALSLKPTLANILGGMAIHYGADVDRITDFIGKDPRIGHKYLRAGLQPGGPCLPRDLRALLKAGEETNADLRTIRAMVFTNEDEVACWREFICKLGRRHFNTTKISVSILGLTYKAGVPVMDDSFGDILYESLVGLEPKSVQYYDSTFPDSPTVKQAVIAADIIVVTQMDSVFKTLEEMDLSTKVVVDPWRVLKKRLVCKAYYGGIE